MPVPTTAETVERVCLRDAAYDRIRGWILDGTLAPGEQLRDEVLADALGMSRTPIREALARLAEEGLVSINATRRTFVSPVTLAQAREVYPIVVSLEALALQLAIATHSDHCAVYRTVGVERGTGIAGIERRGQARVCGAHLGQRRGSNL